MLQDSPEISAKQKKRVEPREQDNSRQPHHLNNASEKSLTVVIAITNPPRNHSE